MSRLRQSLQCCARLARTLVLGGLFGICAAGISVADAATITSRASATLDGNAGRETSLSNVVVAHTGGAVELSFYTDETLTRRAKVTRLGRMLVLAAKAPSCNLDPQVIEQVRITLWSRDLKTPIVLTASETAADSGIFWASAIAAEPSAHTHALSVHGNGSHGKPTVAADGDDAVMARVEGCAGSGAAQAQIAVEPAGVVFASDSDAVVAGATVTLIDVEGASNGGVPNGPARVYDFDGVTLLPASIVTGDDGRYFFPIVGAGRYRLAVAPPVGYTFPSKMTPQQAGKAVSDRVLHAQVSYGAAFVVTGDQPIVGDVPVDPLPRTLFVRLTPSLGSVEVGETFEYTVLVRNAGETSLPSVDLQLTLPPGMALVPGSLRLGSGTAAVVPAGGSGPVLRLPVGALDMDATVTIRLRVRVGVAALDRDGVARAVAMSPAPTAVTSNVATARVSVLAGVFTDKTLVLGKVTADCTRPGPADGNLAAGTAIAGEVGEVGEVGEAGVPGVRLVLEDGTFAITDSHGRYSFYGLTPKTHVLKIDAATLPAGLRPLASSARHAGDGASRFVDPRRGELHRADFALAGCTPQIAAALAARAKVDGELAQALRPDFRPDATAPVAGDTRALPASGLVNADPAAPGAAAAAPKAAAAARDLPLADRVATLDNSLAFVGLRDRQVLAATAATIRVKAPARTRLTLEVNGQAVSDSHVGTRLQDEPRDLQALEFVGVELVPGSNALTLVMRDDFGNVRGKQSITVLAAGPVARLALVLPAEAPADGRDVPVRLELRDANGLYAAARTAVTLDSTLGTWHPVDLDAREAGVQIFVEGGVVDLKLRAPAEPGAATLRAEAASLSTESTLRFVPELRPLIASGLVDGAIQLGRRDSTGSRVSDAFEAELRSFAQGRDAALQGRAAFYLRGEVVEQTLLTLAYDSDKTRFDRLFRDIQPDQFYPIYGDASTRGFDAQSTSRLYLRLDHGGSSLLYGDFVTGESTPARQLGLVQRSLTGARERIETDTVKANIYAARTSSKQVVDERPGNGTSGPYDLSSPGLIENSERVEVLVRDRTQPTRVLRRTPLQRFVDYELEPLSGRLLMRAPVASFDADLNPISLLVTYESEQGGPAFWVAGGDVQVKVDPGLELGAAASVDDSPIERSRVGSVNATVQIAAGTQAIIEVAQVDRPDSTGFGEAARVEVRHESQAVKLRAHAARTGIDFINPSSTLGRGRSESGVSASVRIDERTRVVAESLSSADLVSGARREGALAGIERSTEGGLKIEAGLRHVDDKPSVASLAPTRTDSARAKVSMPVLPSLTAFGEVEQDLHDSNKHLAAIGGDYRFAGGSRLYARHELISSLAGPVALDASQRRQTTLFGVDAETTKDGRVFSEYRLRDGLAGRDGEAAIGLRNQWTLEEGVRLQTGFERVHAVSGSDAGESTALTAAVDYTADPLWKGSARAEWRRGVTTGSFLSTIGLARKIDEEWTWLLRNAFLHQRDGSAVSRSQERFQVGAAYRDETRNLSNGLVRYEYKLERGTADVDAREVQVLSAHADYRVDRRLTLTGQVAAKHAIERIGGESLVLDARLLTLRATREIGNRWDIGAALRVLDNGQHEGRTFAVGVEGGYRVTTNLWMSAGYNFAGVKDRDLAADDPTHKGFMLRLRFKFDESLLSPGAPAAQGAP